MSDVQIGGFGCTGHYGLQGGAKSRDIVEQDIIPALVKGRKVFTNMPLLVDGIMAYFRGVDPANIYQMTDEELKQLFVDRKARGKQDPGILAHALVVIDEAQDIYPSGLQRRTERQALERDAFIQFVAWSRHDDCEVIWASQSFASVDVDLRRRTHLYIHHESLFHLGLGKRWAARYYLPDQNTGDPLEVATSSRTFGPNPIIYRCYKSTETGNHQRSSRLKLMIPKKVIVYGLMTLIVLLAVAVMLFRSGNPLSVEALASQAERKSDGLLSNSSNIPTSSVRPSFVASSHFDDQVDGYICLDGLCRGFRDGVLLAAWVDSIIDGPNSPPRALRPRVLARGAEGLANGFVTGVPR